MTTLYLTRGLPASGKTTYARRWLDERPDTRARVNRDDLRALMFAAPTYKPDQEQLVTEVARHAIAAHLDAGRDVIVDDTNLRPRYVRELRRLAAGHGADTQIMEFPIPVINAVVRDAARPNPVGEAVIRRMAARYMPKGQFLPIPDEAPDVPVDRYQARIGTPPAIIVDIDGTVALMGDRSPYDLTRVHQDKPNVPVIEAVRAAWHDGYDVVFCSGREDTARELTEKWIAKHVSVPGPVFMRAEGDRRKDSIVKRELFDTNIRNHYDVRYVLDDRNQVVAMWRALGLTVMQVAEGAF